MDRIYLDNAATTCVAPEVIEAINEVNSKYFGNPSSVHSVGQEARKIVDEARRFTASFIDCEPEEVVFTSGGSESDNLAIRGLIEGQVNGKPHVITSQVEHHAVLHTIEELEKEGKIEATYLKPDQDGVISVESVKGAVKENTVLVSLIYVNNETGVITPIKEIGEMISGENSRHSTLNSQRIYFHTDAVQAAEFLDISPKSLKVDLLTLTAHKLHGPKGIGALYIKKGTPIKPEITGGSQEFRLRAGTENVAGMAGLHKALELILEDRQKKAVISTPRQNEGGEIFSKDPSANARDDIRVMRERLEAGILETIPDVIVNGKGATRAPHILNVSFLNAEGEAIILNLDFLDIAVSSGSACTSRSLEPSHVLSAMGVPPEKAHGSIRFSLGRYTKDEEIDKVLEVLPNIIKKLREMSPFKTSQ